MSTIWIIDDDDQLRISFQKLLAEEGYHVESAASGESCLKMIQKKLPDLIVLDVRLPGINGLETFKEIHKIDPKLPVIIMTAYGTTETAIEAIKLGAFDYILKPFEIPDMLTLIEQAIEAGRFMRTPVGLNPPLIKPLRMPSSAGAAPCRRFIRRSGAFPQQAPRY